MPSRATATHEEGRVHHHDAQVRQQQAIALAFAAGLATFGFGGYSQQDACSCQGVTVVQCRRQCADTWNGA